MAKDKTKIFACAVDVFVAARTTEDTAVSHSSFPGTDWKLIGYMKAGGVKVSGEAPAIELHDGQNLQTSVVQKFETLGLETDETKLGVIDGFMNKKCDIIFKPLNASETRVWKMLGPNIQAFLEGSLDSKDAIGVKVSGQVNGKAILDIFDQITLS